MSDISIAFNTPADKPVKKIEDCGSLVQNIFKYLLYNNCN